MQVMTCGPRPAPQSSYANAPSTFPKADLVGQMFVGYAKILGSFLDIRESIRWSIGV